VFADPAYFGASHKAGLLAGGGASLLLEQLIANGAVIVYSFVVTALIMLALKATIGVRTAEGSEDAGLDAAEHGEHAYVAD
jgi:Amt family ammonium transporter